MQRVSPTDFDTTIDLKTRLRECSLPTSGNKAAHIEHFQMSTFPDEPDTQCEQPNPAFICDH